MIISPIFNYVVRNGKHGHIVAKVLSYPEASKVKSLKPRYRIENYTIYIHKEVV